MNKTLLLILLVSIGFSVSAQFISESGDTLYGNEWIDHEKDYFKIPIAKDGIYKISYNVLSIAGIPVGELDGSNFQMMHNGKAYPIYVNNSGSLGSGDYIEFYGRRNRGELDRIFYDDPDNNQLNPEYSLFTDTSAYFLTWNTGSGNLRVKEVTTPSSGIDIPLQEFYMHKERVVFSNRVHKPTRNGGDNVRYSHFDIGEGFGGALNQKNEFLFSASDVYGTGPDPSVDIRFTTNATAHKIDFLINNDKKGYFEHFGYELRQERVEFDLEELNASNKITLQGLVDQFDRNILSVVDLNYPREFKFDNEEYFEFFVEGGFDEKFVEVERFDGGNFPVIYDPGSGTRILPYMEDGKYQFVIPGSSKDRYLIAYNSEEVVSEISELEKMEFVDYLSMDGEYIIISHPRLMTEPSNAVDEYASYRGSVAGGGFRTVVVNVEDLYEQFSYGIHRHSYSVKNFVNWAYKNWDNAQYVFILGKGREYGVYRTEAQIQDPVNRNYFVPTFGMPGSDNCLSSNGRESTAHVIPTGRIAAKDEDDISLYLDKVKEHESFDEKPQTIEDQLWKKRIMHLAGAETTLQESIGTYLETMENSIENSQYGASVTTFRKSSTETIQEADADGLLDNIDKGLSILTFFGHSSVGRFDFNIDDVNKLKNFGKYPLVISLGCFSGNVHTESFGISEQYILTAQKGAIAFMASSSTAYVAPQGQFGNDFYKKLGEEYYGRSLGEIFKATLLENDFTTSIHQKILNEQMTLHADPAIKLFSADAPDYVFDHESFRTDPNIIESNQKEFQLKFKVANLGKYFNDSLAISLEHIKSDGTLSSEKDFKIKAPKFDTLVTISFANDDNSNVGRNLIKGILDKDNTLFEGPVPVAEENNLLKDSNGEEGFSFFSINNSAVPVSPCNYAIYNKNEVLLQASTFNALGNENVGYIMQLDTSPTFNSTVLRTNNITSKGGLIEWSPELNFENNKTYYWRISPDSLSVEIGYRWEKASFVYLPNSENGWNQNHYGQYKDNELTGLLVNEKSTFDFDTTGFFIKIFNNIWEPFVTGLTYNFGAISSSVQPWRIIDEGVGIVVGDKRTGFFWVHNGQGAYGSVPGSSFFSKRVFSFKTSTTEERQTLMNFLENDIPDSSFVYFITVLTSLDSDFHPEEWESDSEINNKSLYSILEDEGAVYARQLEGLGSLPYTFIYRKGVGAMEEAIAQEKTDLVSTNTFIPLLRSEGVMQSVEIGPVSNWEKMVVKELSDNLADTSKITVIGISENGEEPLLEFSNETEVDLSFINPAIYSKIKLQFESKDESMLTPTTLKFWRVFYEGFPDLALVTDGDGLGLDQDTIQQGAMLNLKMEIKNLSQYTSDSIELTIDLIDNSNKKITIIEMLPSLPGFGSVPYSFQYSTRELSGKYKLSINISSMNGNEKLILNNFGVSDFSVGKDNTNPILDVLVDGRKIIDGDIISPSPEFVLQLKDENEFLLLDDPNLFEIAITYPSGSIEKIESSDSRLSFEAASVSSKNVAELLFSPEFIENGFYKIEVLASDKSANVSGDLLYTRDFEVVLESEVTEVLNYPNPFSTSTEFVFTITGERVPDFLEIQIMTVSGKTVKEIFKEELGDLKIGVNRTSYKWDGRDEYGNLLSNGVYLYRVIIKDSELDFQKREISQIQSQFKNGIGKLVILR